MDIRHTMEEAFHRGEKIKDQIIHDFMHSAAFNQLLQNEYFLKSVNALLNTKYELKKTLRSNLKSVLKLLDVASSDDIHSVERKLHRLETEVDGIHRQVLVRTAKSKSDSDSHSHSEKNGSARSGRAGKKAEAK